MFCKIFVDAEIAAEVAPGELGQIEPIVQNRPQHAIGETVIEFLVVIFAQVHRRVGNVVLHDRFDSPRRVFGYATAPAEPQAAIALERRPDRNLEPASPCAAVRNTNSVRDYDEPRQYRSPQLRDSLIAVNVMPDIE